MTDKRRPKIEDFQARANPPPDDPDLQTMQWQDDQEQKKGKIEIEGAQLATTTGNVIGLFLIVAKYIFPSKS